MITLIIFLIILAVLVFVHELGHFLAAKFFGIRVDEFALGFPPRIWSKKVGETIYALNAVPLGGYVKIFGEDGQTGSRSFVDKSKWMQIIVLSAGVTMNIIFGWLVLSAGYLVGQPTSAESVTNPTTLSDIKLTIVDVLANSPADKIGLRAGDTIQSVKNNANTLTNLTPDNLSQFIAQSSGPIEITYETSHKQIETQSVTPVSGLAPDHQAIGITMDLIGTEYLSPIQALVQGAKDTRTLLYEIVVGLGQLVMGLAHPSSTLSQVTGPVGIVKVVGEARAIGFAYLLSLIAFISLNLAVINLVPIPALDGGRIFIIIIEAIWRKPLNQKALQKVISISFILILTLVAIITLHDIYNIL